MRAQLFIALPLVAAIVSAPVNAGWQDLLKSAGDAIQESKPSGLSLPTSTPAISSALSNGQIEQGLKEALSVGADRAVALLSKHGGFLNDASVRIPMPGAVDKIGQTMRKFGQGKYVDQFEHSMNNAAEAAIPETLEIVKNVIKGMNLEDVRGILEGGDDAATQFLQSKSGASLKKAISPVVTKATNEAGVTSAYKKVADYGSKSFLGKFVDKQSIDIDDYVADKTLDGLFTKLALEEKKIRENPVARSTDLLKQVFSR